MKRQISGILVASILLLVVLLIFIGKALSRLDDEQERLNAPIGTKVIYQDDTLMVTNYRMLTNDYTLSNGLEIDGLLLEKLEVVTE